MGTPDSLPATVMPLVPRLTVVPRPVSPREVVRRELANLPSPVVAGAGAVVILTVWTFSSKLLAVELSTLMFIDTTASARLLGSISFLGVVLVAAAIALLHRGLRTTPSSERIARQVAVIALAGGYFHLVLWVSRFAAAVAASVASGSLATLMPNMFWWG